MLIWSRNNYDHMVGAYGDFHRHSLPINAPRSHGGNSISSSMAAGSLDVTGDADCSDATGAETNNAASSDDDDGGDADPEPARRRTQARKEPNTRKKQTGRDSFHAPSQTLTSDDAGAHMAKTSHRAVTHTATATAGDLKSIPQNVDIALWRLPTVLAHVPVSRSGWWAGVKSGRYPQPVRLSARCVAWRASDVRSLIESL